jgi:hypothetical protein
MVRVAGVFSRAVSSRGDLTATCDRPDRVVRNQRKPRQVYLWMWYDRTRATSRHLDGVGGFLQNESQSVSGGIRSGTSVTIDPREAAEQLFASSTLVDVLAVIIVEPDRRLYVNELIRRTGRFPRSVQLALAKLEEAGLIQSERRANVRYYRIVKDHPFYPELTSICAKLSDVSFPVRRALVSLDGLRVAFLRPDEPASTDLNVVLVGGDDAARGPAETVLAALSSRLGRAIRVEFFSVEEWARQARRERSYVRWLLDEPRRYLVGGDSDLPSG